MIKTNPAYINGEFLDIKDYFTHLFFTKDRFLYTSIQNWWIQTTLYCSLLQSFVSLLLSVGISCIELSDIYEPIMDTDIILSIIWMPYLYSLPTLLDGNILLFLYRPQKSHAEAGTVHRPVYSGCKRHNPTFAHQLYA